MVITIYSLSSFSTIMMINVHEKHFAKKLYDPNYDICFQPEFTKNPFQCLIKLIRIYKGV